MGNFYIGVNDVARKIKGAYVGVDGVARKVKNIYVGVNNVAQLVQTSDGSYMVFEYYSYYGSTYYASRHAFDVINTKDYSYSANNYNASTVYISDTTKLRIAKKDAKTIVYCTGQSYYVCKEVGGYYQDYMTITSSNFLSYIPTTGNLSYMNGSWYSKRTSLSINGFGLSDDGKYLYIGTDSYYKETEGSNYYVYKAAVVIFDISSSTPTYVNSFVIYTNNYGYSSTSINALYMESNDDLSVLSTVLIYTHDSTSYNSCMVHIGTPTTGYTSVSIPSMPVDSSHYYYISPGHKSIYISPSGNHIMFLVSEPNPDYAVYYEKYWCLAAVDKTNKALYAIGSIHKSSLTPYMWGNTLTQGWIDDKHFYYMYSDSAYASSGTIKFEIQKIENNVNTKLTSFTIPGIYPYDNDLKQNIYAVAIDLKNNIMIYSTEDTTRYYVCSLIGSAGTYTGFNVAASYTLPFSYTSISNIYLKV